MGWNKKNNSRPAAESKKSSGPDNCGGCTCCNASDCDQGICGTDCICWR